MVHNIILLSVIGLFVYFNTKNLKYGLLTLIILTPFYPIIQWILGYQDYSRFWHNGLVLLLLLSIFFRLCVDNKFKKMNINILDILFIIILLYGFYEIVNTYFRTGFLFTGLNGFRNFYFGVFIYFITRFYMRKQEDIKPIFSTMIIIMVVVSVLLLLEVFLVNSKLFVNPLPWVEAANAGGMIYWNERLYIHFGGATFTKPYGVMNIQNTAVFVGMGAIMTIFFYLNKYREKELNFRWWIIFYVLAAGVFLMLSRTVIFAFLICLLLIQFKYKLFRMKVIIPVMLLLLGIDLLGNYNLLTYIFYYPLSFKDTFYATFQPVNYKAEIIPLLIGYGFDIGAYEQSILRLVDTNSIETNSIFPFGSEMRIFNMFNQMGIIGGCLFVLQNVLSYRMGIIRAKKENKKLYKNILLGLSFSIPLVFISTFHYLSIITPGIQVYYYIIMGLISSQYQKGEFKGENFTS